MKKTYVKPELYFESFELAEHIAGCNLSLTSTVDTCTASGDIGTNYSDSWFISKACTMLVEDFCYYPNESNLNTINS